MGRLVLGRRVGQTLSVGNGIRLSVEEIKPPYVRLSIDAPKCLRVLREEAKVRTDAETLRRLVAIGEETKDDSSAQFRADIAQAATAKEGYLVFAAAVHADHERYGEFLAECRKAADRWKPERHKDESELGYLMWLTLICNPPVISEEVIEAIASDDDPELREFLDGSVGEHSREHRSG